MSWINLGSWGRDFHYRSEYFGWLVAAIILFVFTFPLTFYSFAAAGVGLAPISVGFFFFFLNAVSATAVSYFATRTFAAPESIEKTLNSNRMVLLSLVAGVLLIAFLAALIAVHIFNVPAGSVVPLTFIAVLLFYVIAFGSGYDAARLRNTKEAVKSRYNLESENTYLYDVITGKSERKALLVGVLIVLIGTIVGLFSSFDTGLSTTGAIGGVFAVIYQLYPKNEED